MCKTSLQRRNLVENWSLRCEFRPNCDVADWSKIGGKKKVTSYLRNFDVALRNLRCNFNKMRRRSFSVMLCRSDVTLRRHLDVTFRRTYDVTLSNLGRR